MGELSESFVELTKLVCEKIEKVVGFVYDPYGLKNESQNQLKSRIKALNLPPLEEAAFISTANKIIKEYINKNDILQIALDNLNSQQNPKTPKMDYVDDEFLSMFFESAKHVSNEELKLIWGRILANKLSDPNSISKRLIQILTIIEPNQAKLFTAICKNSFLYLGEPIPFIDITDSYSYWSSQNITKYHLLNLQSMGLITLSNNNYRMYLDDDFSKEISPNYPYEFVYSNYKIIIVLEKDKMTDEKIFGINCGNVTFTDVGEELYKVINIEYSDGVIKHFVEYLESQGFSVFKRKIY